MSNPSKWIPLTLTLTVLPGMGHLYLKQKFKGILFISLSLLIVVGVVARFLSVLFALANVRSHFAPPVTRALKLMAETWRLDYPVLVAFLVALLLVWVLAAFDIYLFLKKEK